MQKLPIFILFLIISFKLSAQTPDSLLKPSPVKTLSSKEYTALINGDDLNNFGLVAELNNYPSADKALKYKKELDLSPTQAVSLKKINDALQFKKKEMGAVIVRNEKVIDSLFRTNKLNDGVIIFYTNRYGIYQGELRNAILQAAFKTQQLLSPQQINRLRALKNHN
ncbi:hypothetical protein FFF34_016915 [Inquilinus sp. KBS0705]|nr:hypothetical protein FFF34_016915 [Inquilinus sp. KBS0705]